MTKRERLNGKIESNTAKIEELKKLNNEIYIETLLLCDDKQWYTEKEYTYGRGTKKTTYLEGRIHWKEFFGDSDYPNDETKGVWVERIERVKVDGIWLQFVLYTMLTTEGNCLKFLLMKNRLHKWIWKKVFKLAKKLDKLKNFKLQLTLSVWVGFWL